MNDVLYYIGLLLAIYSYVLFARMIMGWAVVFSPEWRPRGAVAVAFEAVYTVTDPPLRLLRRWIPPINVGRLSLDVGFIVLAMGCYYVSRELMQG